MVKKYDIQSLANKVKEYIKQNQKVHINTYEISAICDVSVSYARRIFYLLLHEGIIDENGIVQKSFEVEK